MSHAAATCTAQRHTPNHLIWLAVQNKVRTIVLEALRVYSMRLVHLKKSEVTCMSEPQHYIMMVQAE